MVRPTLTFYNKPENWRERNRIGLEKVKRELQSCIRKVTNQQSFQLKLTHNGYGHQLMDNEEPIDWHEPILDDCWAVLNGQMRLTDSVTDICGFNIENVEMKKEHLAAIVDIFRSGRATNSSTTVGLENANLCAYGIISLSKLVDLSSNLNYLFLDHNRIDNMDSACCLPDH